MMMINKGNENDDEQQEKWKWWWTREMKTQNTANKKTDTKTKHIDNGE